MVTKMDPATEIRTAWLGGTAPLLELPATVMAPLLGAAWTAPFEPSPVITHLHGRPVSGKTTLAQAVCQYFATAATDAEVSLTAFGGGESTTAKQLLRFTSFVGSLPVLFDDITFIPGKRDQTSRLHELVSLTHNSAGQATTTATIITTGETDSRADLNDPILSVLIDPAEIPCLYEAIRMLNRPTSIRNRAEIGASLLAWTITSPGRVDHPVSDGISATPGLSTAHLAAALPPAEGFDRMLAMLAGTGALEGAEITSIVEWAVAGLVEATRRKETIAVDPHIPNTIARDFLNMISELTRANPELLSPDGTGALGQIRNDRLYLIPKEAMRRTDELAMIHGQRFDFSARALGAALLEAGALAIDKSGKTQIVRRMNGNLMRVWDISLAAVTPQKNTKTKPV